MAQPEADFQLRCQIIKEVKERPLLYNKGHPKYQINSVRTEEFAHIGVAVGKTSEYHMHSGRSNYEITQEVHLS